MSDFDVARAWRDPKYRRSLTAEQRALIPANPAGLVELTDDELASASGAAAFPILTTAITCTATLFLCCPIVTTAITCTQKGRGPFMCGLTK